MDPSGVLRGATSLDRFLERLAARPLPSWPLCILIAAICTLLFVILRVLMGTFLAHQVGFSLLVPAVLLAGLSGGFFTALIAIIFCLASNWLLTQYFVSPPTTLEAFIPPAISFIFISAICGIVGASLRHSLSRHHLAQTRLSQVSETHRLAATQLQAMIDQVSSGILRTDIEGNILESNAQFARMIERPLEDIIGHNVVEFTHPDDLDVTHQRLANYKLPGRTDWQFEKRYLCPDGRTVQALLDVRSLKTSDSNTYGLICIVVDVTATRRAEEALHETRYNFHAVADSVPFLMWITNGEQQGHFVNRAYLDFVGLNADQIRQHSWQALLHPDDYRTTIEQFNTGMQSRQPFSLTARYRRHDGQWRWLRSMHQPRPFVDGKFNGLIGTAFDITETQEAAARVRESETRFRTIADSAPAIIWMVDANGNTEFGNRRFRSIFNGQPPKRLMSAVREMIPPEDIAAFDQTLQDAKREERRFSYLGRLTLPSFGTRWVRTEGAPRYDPQGLLIGFTGVSIDVTESQKAERDLKRINELLAERVNAALEEKAKAEADLVRANRLEAIGRLTGGVAHDFNNLLTVIIGGLDIVLRSKDPERSKKMAEAALAAARRGERLTSQLLAFSRRQNLSPSQTDINALIRESEPLLHKAVENTLVLTYSLSEGEAPALVDSSKFESALINLLINARDATPNNGQVTVETALYRVPPENNPPNSPPPPGDLPPGQYVRVTVSDNGTGMSEEVQKRVFEPFFTTKGVGHGTGLGLSQVYGFTRQSGGSISIESEIDKGTRIHMFLPWNSEPIQPANSEPRSIDGGSIEDCPPVDPASKPRLLNILLVEDDHEVATVVTTLIHSEGMIVDRVETAEQALERLETHNYDVVISDILMPGGISGVELARQLATSRPDQKIILSSGYMGEVEALKDSPWPLLPKPYSAEQLRSVIRDTLAKS